MTSAAEILLAEQLRQAGIPFEQEYRFHPERKWRADFRLLSSHGFTVNGRRVEIIDHSVLVEIDGGGWVAGHHSRGKGIEDDAEKQSAAAILGYRVIRCTPRQVENGTALAWIRQALGMEVAA